MGTTVLSTMASTAVNTHDYSSKKEERGKQKTRVRKPSQNDPSYLCKSLNQHIRYIIQLMKGIDKYKQQFQILLKISIGLRHGQLTANYIKGQLIYVSYFQIDRSLIKKISLQIQQEIRNRFLLANEQKRQVKRLNHQLADIHLCLAVTSLMLNCEQAESEYKKALSYDPKHPQINLSLAILLGGKKRYKEALQHIKQVNIELALTKKHRYNIWYIMLRQSFYSFFQQLRSTQIGEVLKNQIAKKQSIRKILKVIQLLLCQYTQISSFERQSFFQLAKLYQLSNRLDDCLTVAYKLKNINNPPQKITLDHLADLFNVLQQWEQALDCCMQILKVDARNQRAYQNIIKAFCALRRYDQAREYAFMLLEINRNSSKAYFWLGLLQFHRKSIASYNLKYLKLAVDNEPSEINFIALGRAFTYHNYFQLAQRCYFKSILTKPHYYCFCQLGMLYMLKQNYLNGITCLFQAIKYNCLYFPSYFYLGIISGSVGPLRKIINHFMDNLLKMNPQNIQVQANIAMYKLISNQSKHQIFIFVSKFLEEQRKGEVGIYTDIATYLCNEIWSNELYYYSSLISIMIGIFGRAKQRYQQTYQIYRSFMLLINFWGLPFTFIYSLISKMAPKELHAFMLQFIVAEMVKENLNLAVQCFQKSLTYAQGDYKQFYLQLNKKIEIDIEQLWSIDFIANCVMTRQYLSEEDSNTLIDVINLNIIKNISDYKKSLERMAGTIQLINIGFKYPRSITSMQQIFKNIKENINCLTWKFKEASENIYDQIFGQIQSQEQAIIFNINRLYEIHQKKEGEIKQLLQKTFLIISNYLDAFVSNQKIKVVFSHFHEYIVTESCHKQFLQILYKMKHQTFYRYQQLTEDLLCMFKEGNNHTNKVFKVELNQRSQDLQQSENSEMDIPLIDINLQTKSQPSEYNSQSCQQQGEIFQNGSNNKDQIQKLNDQKKSLDRKQAKIIKQQLPKKKIQIYSETSQEAQQQSLVQWETSVIGNSQLQQTNWYNIHYHPNQTKFMGKRYYKKFNEFLHLNTFNLIKDISKQSNLKYIAQHICELTKVLPQQSFKVKVQLGDQVNLHTVAGEGRQTRMLRWIQVFGSKHIIRWICDIALGIAELQKIGIYHADLFFRNTIKVTKGNHFYFKIIDFDKAFKVQKYCHKDNSFECTRNLLDFWLRFKFDNCPRAAIYDLGDQSASSQKASSTVYDPKDIIAYIFVDADESLIRELLSIKQQSIFSNNKRINKCIKLLREHMQVSHLKQYSELVKKLLEKHQEKVQISEQMSPQICSRIMDELERLKVGEVDYTRFAKIIKQIGGVEQGQSEQE